MSIYAITSTGQQIIADQAFCEQHHAGDWTYVGEQPAAVADWRISKGAFFDRFGAQKLPILASADLTVQAIILDCTVRQYIDLQGRAADIGAALDILIAKGFAIDKAAILTTQPTDSERYRP